jgi:hypothetical protein
MHINDIIRVYIHVRVIKIIRFYAIKKFTMCIFVSLKISKLFNQLFIQITCLINTPLL